MQLKGYVPIEITPPENASGGKAVECRAPALSCTATARFDRPAGWYELDVQYFDQDNGVSKFQVFVGDQKVDQWLADDNLPGRRPNGDSSTRRWIPGLALRPGDQIRIVGISGGRRTRAARLYRDPPSARVISASLCRGIANQGSSFRESSTKLKAGRCFPRSYLQLTERFTFQFQANMFGLTNTPRFKNPGNVNPASCGSWTPGSLCSTAAATNNFGAITATSGTSGSNSSTDGARVIWFAGKLIF